MVSVAEYRAGALQGALATSSATADAHGPVPGALDPAVTGLESAGALLAAVPPLEAVAVLLAIAYLLLAIRQSRWCWPAAFVSSLLYVLLMFRARLYMETALQVFYAVLAVYGWWAWQHGGAANRPLAVSTWPVRHHLAALAAVLALSFASAFLLSRYTAAALPFLDSLTTWGAVVATWMVARKLLGNWGWWFVIDSLSIYLYVSRGLYATAALFVLYLVLIVIGYVSWRRTLQTVPA
jgi:nicotinamide mononucleotide transporter